MAKRKEQPIDMTDCCRRCEYNIGVGKRGYMWSCFFLDYCVPFGWHKCEAQEVGKGKFKEKKL